MAENEAAMVDKESTSKEDYSYISSCLSLQY